MTEQTQTPLATLDGIYKGIYEELTVAGKQVRSLQDSLKQLNREFRNLDRQNKAKKKRPQTPLLLSTDLENFLSVQHGTKLTKAEVMKSVSSYIKTKNLQIKTDMRRFQPNKELSKLFGIKGSKPQNMTFVEINKHVSQHLSK